MICWSEFAWSILTCILGVELPVAPLGPLRKCHPLVVLHISILTPISHPPLCGRNQALSVAFEADLEARHWSRIFHGTGNHVLIVNNSVGEKVPSYLQPGCLLPQIQWAVCTSGCSPSICCQLEPCPVIFEPVIMTPAWSNPQYLAEFLLWSWSVLQLYNSLLHWGFG